MKAMMKGYSDISSSASFKQTYGFHTVNSPTLNSLGIQSYSNVTVLDS